MREALERDDAPFWEEAIRKEYESLISMGTFRLVDRPKNRNVVKSKWCLTTKLSPDGNTIARYKARLVAKGYSQMEGVDFTDTYSPTLHKTSLRLLLAMAAAND
jgi:hypothetical protein